MNQTSRKIPNMPWQYIPAGKNAKRFVFIFQPDPDSPSHLATIANSEIKFHYALKAGQQTSRALEVLNHVQSKRPELMPHLDEQFFDTLLLAVSERRLNYLLIGRDLARIANSAHDAQGATT